MIAIQDTPDPDVLALTVRQKIRTGDLNDLIPALERHTSEHDDPHLLIEMEEFRGWENTDAFWEDLKLDAVYNGEFERVAVIGEKRWEAWMTRFTDRLTSNEIRYFFPEEKTKAWNWIRNEH